MPSVISLGAMCRYVPGNDTMLVLSGPPVIDSTGQILLQGVKDKCWTVRLPELAATSGITK